MKKMLDASRMKSDKIKITKTPLEKSSDKLDNKKQCLAIGGVAKARLGFPDTKKRT